MNSPILQRNSNHLPTKYKWWTTHRLWIKRSTTTNTTIAIKTTTCNLTCSLKKTTSSLIRTTTSTNSTRRLIDAAKTPIHTFYTLAWGFGVLGVRWGCSIKLLALLIKVSGLISMVYVITSLLLLGWLQRRLSEESHLEC